MEPVRKLPFTVDLTDDPSVIVGGVDVTASVSALSVFCASGGEPRLRLELDAVGVLEGVGVVEVNQPAASDREAAGRWLSEIDAAVLADVVLNTAGIDRDPIAIALDILREWANGPG